MPHLPALNTLARSKLAHCVLAAVLAMQVDLRAQTPRQVVLISHRVTNLSQHDAENVTAYCIIPKTNMYQDVDSLEIDPPPSETRLDALGQQVITVPLGTVKAGQTHSVRVAMWVRLKWVELLKDRKPWKPRPLPPDEQKAYLADGELLQIDRVRHLTSIIVHDATSDLDKASRLYDYLIHNCVYIIDNHFDPAPMVLSLFPASCSELSYTYVAMCRSVGLPARLVSAYVCRRGRDVSSDWQNYRWAEVYIPEYGWLPADPTTRINKPDFRHFGRQDQRFLAIVDDCRPLEGGHDPEWHVLAAESTTPKIEFDLRRVASWRLSDSRERELAAFRQASRALRDEDVTVRRKLVHSLQVKPDWLRVPNLLEALKDADEEVRLSAAQGLVSSDDPTILLGISRLVSVEPSPGVRSELLHAARSYTDSHSGEKRAAAVRALCKSRTPEALTLLDGAWRDQDRRVRVAVVENILWFDRQPKVLEALKYLQKDKSGEDSDFVETGPNYVSLMATIGLSRLGDQNARRTLKQVIKTPPVDEYTVVLPLDYYEDSWKYILAQQELLRRKLKWPSVDLYNLMTSTEGSASTMPAGQPPSLTSLIQQPEAIPPTYRSPPSELERLVPNRYLEEKTTKIRPP